ncbi:protein FAM171B-like [Brachionichthys hirsutus]|uniref:protein FAM171B-like n=1 Tax=Brachionichthys hirsutus TaxID=412623 RepID=UPI003604E9DF
MRSFRCVISALIVCGACAAAGELTPTRPPLRVNDGNFPHRDHVTEAASGSAFSLKVQVNDALSRARLSQAVVDVYTNYTLTSTAVTGEDGGVSLLVPYRAGTPITIVAGRDGYVRTPLPCKPNRRPIFTSVTVSLMALRHGNIWLFEDSVLITGKSSDPSSLPAVRFPKNLLNLTGGGGVSSLKAFLTVPPKLPPEDGFQSTVGVASSRSGYVSVELSPLAAVSIQLFSGDREMNVAGPLQISLSIPDGSGLQASDVIPAWFLNRTTGGWMRKGLGRVASVEGKLAWTFSAPHLGYWIAAPLSPTRGFFRIDVPTDFLVHYSSFLTAVLGGMLLIAAGLLVGLLSYHRRWLGGTETKIQPVTRRDRSTSTRADEDSEVSSEDSFHPRSVAERRCNLHNDSFMSAGNGSVVANAGAAAVGVGWSQLELHAGLNDLRGSRETTDQVGSPCSLAESFFYYNQPVAILQAPAFFHVEERPEQLQRSKSATLPRSGAANCAAAERPSRDGVVQTPSLSQNQAAPETKNSPEDVEAPEERPSTSRAHFSLQESASVPGTLNKIGGKRHSLHALAELSEIPSLQPPRAWFVSLEGKPAAEIHYAVPEQQRRRRPAESRDTSLDSGVDMSELNQASGRRAVAPERNATFVKNTPSANKRAGPR